MVSDSRIQRDIFAGLPRNPRNGIYIRSNPAGWSEMILMLTGTVGKRFAICGHSGGTAWMVWISRLRIRTRNVHSM